MGIRRPLKRAAGDDRVLAADELMRVVGYGARPSSYAANLTSTNQALGIGVRGLVITSASLVVALTGCSEPSPDDQFPGTAAHSVPATQPPATQPVETGERDMLPVSLAVDTRSRVDISWLGDSTAWSGRPYPVSSAVLRHNGSVASYVIENNSVTLSGAGGAVRLVAAEAEDSAGARPTNGFLHRSVLGHELAFFDAGRHRVTHYDTGFHRFSGYSVTIGRQNPVATAGVLHSGEVVLVVRR
jgi:hypothetical protein